MQTGDRKVSVADGPEQQHEGGDAEGRGSGGRPHERDPQTSTDSSTADADRRDDDSEVSDEDGALSATRDEVDSVDDAIDAEIVDAKPRRTRSILSEWSGKLPHPDDLERYEAIEPGTLHRLIALEERRMGVLENEVKISEKREDTIRSAIDAESDVKRSLAEADTGALKRGQWLSWSISLVSLSATILGLILGHPQALWAIVVPVVQAGASLVRTVSQSRDSGDSPRQEDAAESPKKKSPSPGSDRPNEDPQPPAA